MIGLIPARKGSKGIPLKNVKEIAGKKLIAWVIEAANNSILKKTYVSTDSLSVKHLVRELNLPNIELIDRAEYTAIDTASTADVMIDFAGRVPFEDLMVIQATSPLLTTKDINLAVYKYSTQKYDSLVSVVRQHRFVWKEEDGYGYPVNHKLLERPRRQDWDGMFVENGAFIITSRKALMRTRSRLSGVVGLYEMPEETYLEVDTLSDLKMIEPILEERNAR